MQKSGANLVGKNISKKFEKVSKNILTNLNIWCIIYSMWALCTFDNVPMKTKSMRLCDG